MVGSTIHHIAGESRTYGLARLKLVANDGNLIKDGRVHVDAVLSIDRVAEVCVELCNAMVVSLMRL